MKTPTTQTIEAARRKADGMWGLYDVTPSTTGIQGRYLVQHKQDPRRCYVVDQGLNGGTGKCSCPAFRQDGTCKHACFCHECVRIAEGEAMADLVAEETGQAAREAAKVWPVCGYHGPHYAADNGAPVSFCDRCQKMALA